MCYLLLNISKKHFTSRKSYARTESGTCSACASLCLSSMYFNPALAPMGLKSDNLSDEVCQENAACPHSFKDADSLFPFKTRACDDDRHHTCSETSNLLSVCSSHDSSSENAKSKAILRVSDASEGISMLSNAAFSQAAAKDQGLLGPKYFCGNRTLSNQHEMQLVSECNGDDMSCISRAESPSMSGDHRCDMDKKNVSCCSASVDSFLLGGLERTVGVQLAFQASSNFELEEGHNYFCTPTKFSKESLQETAPFSGKSNPSEVSSLGNVYVCARSRKGDLSECSGEQEESPFVRGATITLEGHKYEAFQLAASMKPKTEVDEGDPASAVKKQLGQNEALASLELTNVQGPLEQSQTVKCSDESDLMVDVNVCDICGDAGREHLLATCSKCSDGAEHIYCMRVRLEKVPRANWMCEDCMLQEETEKQKQNKFPKVISTPKSSSSNEIHQKAGYSNTNIRTGLELYTKDSDVEKSGRDEVSSIPHISAKRPVGNLESDSITKRRALKASVGSSRMFSPCRKTVLSQDSPHENLENVKVKPTCHVSTFGYHSFNSSQGNARSSMISGSNSPKSRTSLQISRGVLAKSNAFNISDSKLKVQAPAEHILEKQKISQDKRKHGIVRIMSRSLSFSSVSSGHSKAANSKIKMLSSSISLGKDMKRFKHAKEDNLNKRKDNAKFDKPQVSSPVAGSCISASGSDKKLASRGEIILPGEDIVEKHKSSRETAASDKRKHGIVKMMNRSMSFSSVSSGHSKAADSKIKMLSSSSSLGKDFKRFKHAKEDNLSERKYNAKLDNPVVSSLVAGSYISASGIDKKIESCGEMRLPCSSGTKCFLKPVQSHGNSNISSKPTYNLAHEGSKYLHNDQAGSGMVKKLHLCLSKVVGDPASLTKSDSHHEFKPDVVSGKDRFRASAPLTAGKHFNSSNSVGQHVLPQSQVSCNQGRKALKTSYFSSAKEHISAGNRSAYSHECGNIGEVAVSCQIMSPQTSALDTGSSKEANQNNDKVCRPIICDQTDAHSTLAIPKLDFIWKGGFKIQNSGRLPSFCYGIQAHLSTCASPKVPEVVKKFPCNVLLEEVSRLSVWPIQFLENHPKEDSIGVYFFAEDIVSYGENYRSLMECMINYDLALKGDVDGIDLLIFSSNLLPEKSQSWNKLFFLWGVFRGRRISNEECMPSSKKLSIPGLSNVCSDQDLSIHRISGIQNMCSSGQSRECLSASKLFCNTQQPSSLIDPQELPSVSSGRRDGNYEHQPSSDEQRFSHLLTKFDQRPSTDDTITSNIPMQKQLCRDTPHTLTSLKECGFLERRLEDYEPSPQAHDSNMDPAIWSSGRAHNSSGWQGLSADCKDFVESEFLDLGLSLGVGKKSAKRALVSPFHRVVDKNQEDKNPISIASNKNNNGGDDKFSASVELTLTLPSYNK